MKRWGIVLLVLGLALAVYSYGVGFIPFIIGAVVALVSGTGLVIHERRTHA